MAYLDIDPKNTDLTKEERDQLVNEDERQALLNSSLASARHGGGRQARNLANPDIEAKAFDS